MAELSGHLFASVDPWEWQLDGSCRLADPRLFFHLDGEPARARRKRDVAAQRVCAACPVMEQCREYGLAGPETYGVWGGLTEGDREKIYNAQRAG